MHAGDDLAFARPDFDDSSWTPFNAATDSLHMLFRNTHPEIVWYRLHVRVMPAQTGLALLNSGMCQAFEIYSNGMRLIHVGEIYPYHPGNNPEILASLPSDQIAGGSIVIAVRVRLQPAEWRDQAPGLFAANLTLGQYAELREHMWINVIGYNALSWLDSFVLVAICLGSLLLFSSQRDRPEYMWLFLWTLTRIPSCLLSIYGLFHSFPSIWHVIDSALPDLVAPYFMTRMFCEFVEHRVGWRLQFYAALAGAALAAGDLSFFLGLLTVNQSLVLRAPYGALVLIVLPAVMLARIRRGKGAETVLVVPLLMTGIYLACSDGAFALSEIPALHGLAWPVFMASKLTFIWPFLIEYRVAIELISMVSLALIILIRSNRVSRRQALLQSEIAQAREVQQVILPESIDSIPGFEIESAYFPAREVGGDFFQILLTADGGMLLVIGDVAGKGLPAAMLVSVLVGAIRTAVQYDHTPQSVLAQLNERMTGRTNGGGFTTALAALIAPDGSAQIANAGHLPPYLNGDELDLPPALPLGVVTGAQYEVTRVILEPGDRLTFYTDGVIEAQNGNRELFGFDRARAISTKPPAAIASAAKTFGQEDDITVIAICRHPDGKRHEDKQIDAAVAPLPA